MRAVISTAAGKSPRVREEIATAFECDRPPVLVQIDKTTPSAVEERLSARPGIQIEAGEIPATGRRCDKGWPNCYRR